MLAREGYTEDSWIIPFQKQTGCRVLVRYLGPGDDTSAILSQGTYDVVSLASEDLPELGAARVIRPIDPALVPHFRTLRQGVRNAPALVRGGALLGVPFQWGPDLLIWNSRALAHTPISWNALYLKRNSGRVSIPDDPIQIADAALLAESQHPSLHIRSPFQLSEKQLRAALRLLGRQKKLSPSRWGAASDQVSAFVNGAALLGAGWSYVARELRKQGIRAQTEIPLEGATAWLDSWSIVASATHLGCAYRFLDYSTRVGAGQDVAPRRRGAGRARRVHAARTGRLPSAWIRRRRRSEAAALPHDARHVVSRRAALREREALAGRLEQALALTARVAQVPIDSTTPLSGVTPRPRW